jgi:formylglycine-generating enzyme required for sulfatase activity
MSICHVEEWTVDDAKPYPGNDKYLNESFGKSFKVIRGGAFDYPSWMARVTSRAFDAPSNEENDVGFRCAK